MKPTEPIVENLKTKVLEDLMLYYNNKNTKGILSEERETMREEAKISSATYNAITRANATKIIDAGLQFSIIKSITENPKARKAYIKATLPSYIPRKKIGKT